MPPRLPFSLPRLPFFRSSPLPHRTITTTPPFNNQPPKPPPTAKDLTQKLTTSLTSTLPSSPPSPSSETPGVGEEHISPLDLQKLQSRFYPGDTYAPHDLSHFQQRSRRQRRSPRFDACDLVGINPLKEYKNFCLLSEYVSEMGRIKHSSETGLRPVNQRRMAKAIRRAIALGFMPATHRHPEYLMHVRERREGRGGQGGGGGGRF